jgi:hypothetical protein
MKTKRKLISLTALVLAAAMALSACQKVDDNPIATDTASVATTSLTKMTEETTTPPPILTTTTVETTTENLTTPPETITVSETTPETTTASETTTAATASGQVSANGKWVETAANRSMFTNQTCYSRVEAVLGAQIVKEYSQGTPVEIVATTDTGYCKLSDGTFIHSDYLSTTAQSGAGTTAVVSTAARPVVTTAVQTGSVITSTDHNTSYQNRYFWSQLTADEQTLYGNIVSAAEDYYTGGVTVPAGMTTTDVTKIYFLVFNSEPQLFWLDTTARIGIGSISLRYCISKDEIPTIQSEIDANVKKIMNTASGASNLNKIKVFYDWIVLNNEFHLDDSAQNCGIEHGLRPHAGAIQCLGYARTMQYLCDIAGIPCITITGESVRGASHAWNKLQLSGKWYNIDATRGDPINDYDANYIAYSYYLVPDSWIASSHLLENQKRLNSGTILNYYTAPSATDSSLNYFKLYNKEFSTTDSAWNGICAELKRALGNGANTASIRVTTDDIYETLISTSYWKAAQDYARTIKPGVTLKLQKTDLAGVKVVQYNIDY